MSYSQIIATVVLGLLLLAEAVGPAFIDQRKRLGRLVRHDLRNLLIGVFNAALTAFVFVGLMVLIDRAAAERGFGVVRWLGLSGGWAWAAALLLFDCWMYWWHRVCHVVPLFWRFHRMHHSDTAMDASSGVRFHPGEIFLSGIARLAVLPIVGMTVEQLAVYNAVSLPIVLVQHANIRLPRWLDFGLFQTGLLVTPAMHRVHHSDLREETNSNYSSVLAIWDRLFGSLRVREDVESIRYGLAELRDERSQTLIGMLATPVVETTADGAQAAGQEKSGEA